MRDDEQTIQTTMWIMIFLQTIGSVDMPGKGERKLPAPRAYVAITVTWSILGLAASLGWGRLASRMAITLTLVGAVLGPFGMRAIDFLNTVAHTFAIAPTTTETSTPAQSTQGFA